MVNERMIHPLRVALASYDRKELRVQKRYLEEEGSCIECSCFQFGALLLEALEQADAFDAVVLCREMADMPGEVFLDRVVRRKPHIPGLALDERRRSEAVLFTETENGILHVGPAQLKTLLWQLYRMPGQQGQEVEHRCMELYAGWGIRLPDANADYLTCAVSIVYSSSQKLAIRKEILQAVGQQFDISVSAVDSGIRRMIDQLEAEAGPAWTGFKRECGFDTEKPTTGKLIYAVKNRLQQHSTV